MASRTYQNFDVLVETTSTGYRARVVTSPTGETPTVDFTLPFDATVLENLLLKLDPGRSGTRRVAQNPQIQAARDFGGPLFDAVFAGDVALAWGRGQDAVAAAGKGLRLRLRLTDAPAVAGLPWELLYDRRRNAFLAQSERTPLVRYLDVPQPIRPLSVTGALRILVIISSPTDLAELDGDAEYARVEQALTERITAGQVILDRLPKATISQLGQWLRSHDAHVLHFVGHGEFDTRLEEGVLYFCDDYGRSSAVTSSVLGPFVRDHDPLRLVVLNACRSAHVDQTDPFSGMAQGLVQQDAAAVVAMQFPISDGAAIAFTADFYGAVADGLPVDQAVTSARKTLNADYGAEWATPILFLRASDGEVFRIAPPTVPATARPPAERDSFEIARGQGKFRVSGRQYSEADRAVTATPPPAPEMPPGSLASRRKPRLRWPWDLWVRRRTSPRHPPPPGPVHPTTASRTAYPRIDLVTGTARPDVVVVDVPFVVTVGLGPRKARGVVSSGSLVTTAGQDAELEVVLVYDPGSLVPAGATRFPLVVTDADPYPAVTVGFTACYLEEGPPTRRVGVHYLREGQVVAVAFRSFACVDDAASVAAAPAVPARDAALLDLAPVAAADAPDLVVAVCRSDASPTSWVWTAYPGSSTLAVPDAPNVAGLGDDVSGFALNTRRAIQFSTDRVADYYTLAGRAKRIGAAIPQGIQAALHAVITEPGRTLAPAVLLLTEELYVPWELGTIDPPLTTPWGGTSPFLGAHAAIGRWPLSEHKPRPAPRSRLHVRAGAVVTADYTGVPGWGKLEHALTEGSAVAALFSPPATSVRPDLVSVIDLLRGTPAADVVHLALHGQFDAQGDQEGIVLLTRNGTGPVKPIFLTPLEVENGDLGAGPLVFLNACQVGADKRVLGSYGGFATTLLRIGAGAVVAPLWNIDDDVAAWLAQTFYAQTWTAPQPVGIGEAMRSIRARYTEEAVEAGTPGITATLLAFQVFAHPRLRLIRPS